MINNSLDIEYAIKIVEDAINDESHDSIINKELRDALEVILVHLKTAHLDNETLASVVNSVYMMHRRNNEIDRAYRDAAKYILDAMSNK